MQGSLKDVEFDIKEIEEIEDGKKYKITIKVPKSIGKIENIKFITEHNGIKNETPLEYIEDDDKYIYFEENVELKTFAMYKYYFSFEIDGDIKLFKNENKTDDKTITDEEKWKMSVNFKTPDWTKGKIMYQIFVDRFNRGSKEKPKEMPRRTVYNSFDDEMVIGPNKDGIWNADFYGGDLKGIEEKLDYIKSLGVSIIYLNPIVWSQSNHRYDTSNYEKVDPYVGTNEDLKSLCDKAHSMGIKVVLDAVFNHTGNDSIYYNEFNTFKSFGAFQSKTSPYYKFYRTIDDGFYPRWGLKKVFPKLREENKKWQRYIYDARGIIDIWYNFDKDNKTERLETSVYEDVAKWAEDFFSKHLDSNSYKYENNEFSYLCNGKYIPISNRMIYVLHSLKDKIEEKNLNIKDTINYVFLDALLTFYKTNNGDKLSLVFDEFRKIYPEDTLLYIVKYINSNDITKVVSSLTDEELVLNSNNAYGKYLQNHKDNFWYWWGMQNLPVCDGNNKEWQQYIYGENGVIDGWFKLGIDGLRLDVADELSDEFIEGIRKAVKRNKEDGFILGEVWKPIPDMHRGYIYSGKGMDAVMNYPLSDALTRYFKYCDINKLKDFLYKLINDYPEEVLYSLMNPISTHDISRLMTIYGSDTFNQNSEWVWNPTNDDRNWQNNYKLTEEEYKKAKEMYKAHIYTLAFLPGTLSIFYGDEIGLEGMGNLSNRKPFPWTKKDEELLEFFKMIGKVRNEEPFLEKAKLNIVDINDKLFTFERTNEEEKAFITVNRTDDEQKIYIPKEYESPDKICNLNGLSSNGLAPHGGLVLKKVRR